MYGFVFDYNGRHVLQKFTGRRDHNGHYLTIHDVVVEPQSVTWIDSNAEILAYIFSEKFMCGDKIGFAISEYYDEYQLFGTDSGSNVDLKALTNVGSRINVAYLFRYFLRIKLN